ncbi:MAG: hypothetical protein ACOYEL_06155, partial [Saccharofermentanales bacterium]
HPRLRTRRLPCLELPMYPAALMRISGFEIYFSILGTSTRIGLSGFITFFEHFRVKGLIFDLFCNTIKMLFFTFGQSQSPIPNALKGIEYLDEHPEARASDLMDAFRNKEIKAS